VFVWGATAFVIALLIALIAASLFLTLRTPRAPCETVDATSITRETATKLRTEGWYADSTDDYERLYSPGCLTRGAGRE
jgi:hypothetical protein